MKKIRNIVWFFASFVVVFFASLFPFNFLQLENADGYAEYKKAKSAYESYLKKYGKEPQNLNFLPQEIQENIGKKEYPIKFINETGDLIYKYPRPYPYGKSNLIDYVFHRRMTIGSTIGHITKMD